MENTPVFLYVLIGGMIVGAMVAVETADLLSAAICVGAVGFALSVIDLLLGAPDLAITQVVVEVVCLIILIRAVIHRRETEDLTGHWSLEIGVTLLVLGVFLALTFTAMAGLTPFGEPLLDEAIKNEDVTTISEKYLREAKKRTGATNVVTAILLDFRAYDTLGEATVVFVSIIGAVVVLRPIGRLRRERHEPDS